MIYGLSLQDGHHLWIVVNHRLLTILRRANLTVFLLTHTPGLTPCPPKGELRSILSLLFSIITLLIECYIKLEAVTLALL
jgi:hypothetical protein